MCPKRTSPGITRRHSSRGKKRVLTTRSNVHFRGKKNKYKEGGRQARAITIKEKLGVHHYFVWQEKGRGTV